MGAEQTAELHNIKCRECDKVVKMIHKTSFSRDYHGRCCGVAIIANPVLFEVKRG